MLLVLNLRQCFAVLRKGSKRWQASPPAQRRCSSGFIKTYLPLARSTHPQNFLQLLPTLSSDQEIMRSQLQAHQRGSPGHPGPPAPACLPPEGQAQKHRIPPRPDTGNHQPFWRKLQHYDMAHMRREPRHRTEAKATPAGSGLLPRRLWPLSRPDGGQPACHPHEVGRAHSSVFCF